MFLLFMASTAWAASFGGPDVTETAQVSPSPSAAARVSPSPSPVASAVPAAVKAEPAQTPAAVQQNQAVPDTAAVSANQVSGSSFYISAEQDFVVSVDGRELGNTPLLVKGLSEGNHELSARNAEGGVWKVRLQAVGSAPGSVLIFIPHVSVKGGIAVESSPAGARIFVDGVSRGITPSTVDGLSPGKHEVSVSSDKLSAGPDSVNVESGKTVQRRYELERQTNVVFEPRLGPVVVVELLDEQGTLLAKQYASANLTVPKGNFIVRLSGTDNQVWQKPISAKGEEKLVVDTSAFSAPAKISLQTLPYGVHISIDGAVAQAGALTAGIPVAGGAHVVGIFDDSGKTRSVALFLAAGSATDLKPEVAGFQSSPSLNLGQRPGSAANGAAAQPQGPDMGGVIASVVAFAVGLIINLDPVAAGIDGTWETYQTLKYVGLGVMGASTVSFSISLLTVLIPPANTAQ